MPLLRTVALGLGAMAGVQRSVAATGGKFQTETLPKPRAMARLSTIPVTGTPVPGSTRGQAGGTDQPARPQGVDRQKGVLTSLEIEFVAELVIYNTPQNTHFATV